MRPPLKPFQPHGQGGPRIHEIPLRLIVPNLITVFAICAGLSGIRMAFEGRFQTAVVLVLFAALLDGIDGRIARALKASSKFGAEMDSLADFVNFGVAPALVLYAYLLDKVGSPGWMAALIFAIACGLRLARFNVLLEDEEPPVWQRDYFVGVPAPAGAAIVMLPAYLGFLGIGNGQVFVFASLVYTILIGVLMISRAPVFSGKRLGLRVRGDFVLPLMLCAVAYVLLLAAYPWSTLTASVAAYLVFLPLSAVSYARTARREAEKSADIAEKETSDPR